MRQTLCMAFAGLVLCGLLCGCPYSTRSGLPEHIQTVQVPMFKNSTMYKGLETKLTGGIIRKLQVDPRVRVVNRGGNATIRGEIIDVQRSIYRETREDRPATVHVNVTVRFTFFDEVEKRSLISEMQLSSAESSSAVGLYEVDRGELQSVAEEGAVSELADEIVRRSIAVW